jgi:hypothetical protein
MDEDKGCFGCRWYTEEGEDLPTECNFCKRLERVLDNYIPEGKKKTVPERLAAMSFSSREFANDAYPLFQKVNEIIAYLKQKEVE